MIIVFIFCIIIIGCINSETEKGSYVRNPYFTDSPSNFSSRTITLSYCPTMESYAKKIAEDNLNVILDKDFSTASVLSKLKNKKIDIALVGRIADSWELDNVKEIRLKDGYTLIGPTKNFVLESNLKDIEVHTAISESIVQEYFPELENIVYYMSVDDALTFGKNKVILIDWKDYKTGYNLIIPLYENNNKVEKYRIPTLYVNDDELIIYLNLEKYIEN
jgi:hypothetical protein